MPATMSLTESLLNLYKIDMQLRGLRSRLDSAERYLAIQERQLEAINVELQEAENRSKHVRAVIHNHETEIAAIDERLEKLRDELNAAVNNKQYTAVLTELNTAKEQRGTIEDQVIQEMEQTEEIDQRIADLKEQRAEREKVRDIARTQLNERQGEVGDRLAELESEREAASADIPADRLAAYEVAAQLHDGEAMSSIEEIDRRRREYACGECNMHLPFELVANQTAQANTLVHCPACSRILYMIEELRGDLVKK